MFPSQALLHGGGEHAVEPVVGGGHFDGSLKDGDLRDERERENRLKTSFVVVNASSHFVPLAIYNVTRGIGYKVGLGCVNPPPSDRGV